jgi:hypothetical protein
MDAEVGPANSGDNLDVLAAGDPPGILGVEAIPLDDTGRIIAKVKKDWEPPSPDQTPIVATGTTLLQAGQSLNRHREWGEGGGRLEAERIAPGNSTNLTVTLHAHLVHHLPTWTGYAKASKAAQAEWDRMVGFLKIHEDRHLEIAIEEANQLAQDLVGHDIGDIAQMVTEANRRMHDRQEDMDHDSEHGAKAGVPYGDVILDISIN